MISHYERILCGVPKTSNQKLQEFPQFARLPEELQLIIWQFACLLPQVVRLGEATRVKLGPFGKTVYYLRKVVNYSGVHPLLLETFKSRQVALDTLGEGFSVDFVPLSGASIRTCYTIRFRPHEDTVYVSDVWTLDMLSRYYHICPKSSPLSGSGLAVIKSLALEGLGLPNNLRTAWGALGRGRHFEPVEDFLCSMIDLIALEELILIAPTIQKEVITRNLRGKPVRKLVTLPEKEQKEQLIDLLKFVAGKLREAMEQNRLFGRRRTTSPESISDCW